MLLSYLSFAILPYSFVGSLQFPSLVRGFSLPGISPRPCVSPRMVPLGFILTVLVGPFPLCSFSLVHPHRLACFGLEPFLRFLVPGLSLLIPLLLFFSPLCVSCPFLGGLPEVSCSVYSSGGALFLSYLPVLRAATASSLLPLPCSFHVRSFRGCCCSSGCAPFAPVRALRVFLIA